MKALMLSLLIACTLPTIAHANDPLPATGRHNAKAVLCLGAAGEFYMNFPQIRFSQNQFGQTIVSPGLVSVGYKLAGQSEYTKYDDPYMPAMNNGPAVILQTTRSSSSFAAFVYTSAYDSKPWVQATGDLRAYGFDGQNGTIPCRFFQSAIVR